MIISDGYTLEYYKGRNQIVIGLPQTEQTATNTISMVTKRKIDLTDEEQMMILAMVKYVMGERQRITMLHTAWIMIQRPARPNVIGRS